ncbi:MAG: ribonuclease Y [Thermoanaerobaculia bacterium]|nr:ribonuclease Y [Thermoanaerobaculia bacterium]
MNEVLILVGVLLAAVLCLLVYLIVVRGSAKKILAEAEEKADALRDKARTDSDAKLREADLAAKEKLLQAKSEFEKVSRQKRQELEQLERRLNQKEDNVDQRTEDLARREKQAGELERELARHEKELNRREEELTRLLDQERHKLEQIAGLTGQQAKEELTRVMETEARNDAAHLVKRIEDEAKENANRDAQRILANAIQRNASDFVSETTVSVVLLPNDEMKGRIIGREGRNIRALEMATGVDLIVDDTPEAVILSGFDPFRREIARVALERLIQDGRIHPARIEEVVSKAKQEFEEQVQQEGESALLELNIPDLHPELVKLLGKLRFRTSYGQNVLKHSKEVAYLAATMAAELRVDIHIAKRAGLLHDIGKAVDREMEGSHLELGIDLLRKYGEDEKVIHAMACHHGDYEPETVEAVLVTASDALSAARPGARREILESYIKRLEKLEEVAQSFKGVQKTFAIQAGREIRVIVDSQKISDEDSVWLSKNIAKKVEAELTYPGEIKVTVIRETRSIEFAR